MSLSAIIATLLASGILLYLVLLLINVFKNRLFLLQVWRDYRKKKANP